MVAGTEAPVLIQGETGTGKEVIAKYIHETSDRKDKKFRDVNCVAIPGSLFESEMFGYKKGAFTGALTNKTGIFEDADDGTIFLDEIGDLSLEAQAKLLRVLDERFYYPTGSNEKKQLKARIIAATNIDLEKAVEEGKFRKDLYYRLNTFSIQIPPLRERPEDIELLARFFLNKMGKKEYSFSREALDAMKEHDWQGNVRQLNAIVLNAVTECEFNENGENHIIGLPYIKSISAKNEIRLPEEDKQEEIDNYNKLLIKIGTSGLTLDEIVSEIIASVYRQNDENLNKTEDILKIGHLLSSKHKLGTGRDIRGLEKDFDKLTKDRNLTIKKYKSDVIVAIWENENRNRSKTAEKLGVSYATACDHVSLHLARKNSEANQPTDKTGEYIDPSNIEDINLRIGMSGLSIDQIRSGIYWAVMRKNNGDKEKTHEELGLSEKAAKKYKDSIRDTDEVDFLFSKLVKDRSSTHKEYLRSIVGSVSKHCSSNNVLAAVKLGTTRAVIYEYIKKGEDETTQEIQDKEPDISDTEDDNPSPSGNRVEHGEGVATNEKLTPRPASEQEEVEASGDSGAEIRADSPQMPDEKVAPINDEVKDLLNRVAAPETGISPENVRTALVKSLELSAKKAAKQFGISPSSARSMINAYCPNFERNRNLLKEIIATELPIKEIEKRIKEIARKNNPTEFDPDSLETDITEPENIEDIVSEIGESGLSLVEIRTGIYQAALLKNGENIDKTLKELDINKKTSGRYKNSTEKVNSLIQLFSQLVKNQKATMDELTTQIIKDVYEKNSNDKNKASKQLQCSESAIYRYLTKETETKG